MKPSDRPLDPWEKTLASEFDNDPALLPLLPTDLAGIDAVAVARRIERVTAENEALANDNSVLRRLTGKLHNALANEIIANEVANAETEALRDLRYHDLVESASVIRLWRRMALALWAVAALVWWLA